LYSRHLMLTNAKDPYRWTHLRNLPEKKPWSNLLGLVFFSQEAISDIYHFVRPWCPHFVQRMALLFKSLFKSTSWMIMSQKIAQEITTCLSSPARLER
jgi:hypothetical protein